MSPLPSSATAAQKHPQSVFKKKRKTETERQTEEKHGCAPVELVPDI